MGTPVDIWSLRCIVIFHVNTEADGMSLNCWQVKISYSLLQMNLTKPNGAIEND